MLSAFWWSFTRDRRSLLSEIRHNSSAWVSMAGIGGGVTNFGDELSRLAIAEATGTTPKWRPIADADLVGIGSILELYLAADSQGFVWGTGLRDPGVPRHGAIDPRRVLAVRGALTRQALGASVGTPMGDPGLLARSIFTRSSNRRGTVVVPHFSVFGTGAGRAYIRSLRADGMEIVPPSAPVDKVCEAIARADLVLTSSLHGLVVSDALETPVALVAFPQAREARHKYEDYASVFGEEPTWYGLESIADHSARRTIVEDATRRAEAISSTVDLVVEGLLKAATPLR